jgi:hypothetical protein
MIKEMRTVKQGCLLVEVPNSVFGEFENLLYSLLLLIEPPPNK